jgi:hypothetical protein
LPTTSPQECEGRAPSASDAVNEAISTGTHATLKQRMLEAYHECMFPGCNVVSRAGVTLDYCFILPERLETLPQSNAFVREIFGRAGLIEQHISSLKNGMLLCKNHHDAFDQYAWTVKPEGFAAAPNKQICRVNKATEWPWLASGDRKPMKAASGTQLAWTAYNAYIFCDEGTVLENQWLGENNGS